MEIISILKHAVMITFFVFVMMLLVDFVDSVSQRRLSTVMQGGRWRQYALSSFLGAVPGCLGAFMNISFYVHGMISFGALVGGMIATSGDEAFVMLARFPGTALCLFGLLFAAGILFARIGDKLIGIFKIVPCEVCREAHCEHCLSEADTTQKRKEAIRLKDLSRGFRPLTFARFLLLLMIGSCLMVIAAGIVGPEEWNWKRITFLSLLAASLYITLVGSEHYLEDHIWGHIIKRHLFRVFLWTFGALLFVHWGLAAWNLGVFVREHRGWMLLMGALIGVIPESGPHLIFVMMYAEGLVPFSVLFTTSFVQDGHGMLPLLSYSVKDSILIKALNLAFGLAVGSTLFVFGF
jgi:hypothetical protein